ncbi:MAG: Y-family DNA polymerase [Flavobacteriaceae bacterium]|nr:Y-family DNA polymerase [Flavobacteriaceae bacterium]MCY4253991.1 Y-family DNA polymerase [Flavobacteriaceae bacterium]
MYALVDCNNFYVSCERAFHPKFIGKPMVVLSNNDGCVISRSHEAKSVVPMGAVTFQYRSIFEKYHISVFSSNFPLYGDMSQRVMGVLNRFTPDMEIYSIDEAFLEFNELKRVDFKQLGHQIKQQVKQITQIPISIGFGKTKTLAKIANRMAKKFPEKTSGVFILDTEDKRIHTLQETPVEDVWGIGRQTAKKLHNIGITNALEYIQRSDQYLRKHFSVVGLRLKYELQGTSVLKLEEVADKKSIATTRSFATSLTEYADLKERVSTFASSCAEKLRKQQAKCRAIMVLIRTDGHRKERKPYRRNIVLKLPYASSSDITLSHYASRGLQVIYKKGYAYKKAGVILMDVQSETYQQLNLFTNENPKHQALMQTMDAINHRWGAKKVKLASQYIPKTWVMRQERLSKRYTTHWQELLEVE